MNEDTDRREDKDNAGEVVPCGDSYVKEAEAWWNSLTPHERHMAFYCVTRETEDRSRPANVVYLDD